MNNLELIALYMSGEMEESEKRDFEARLNVDETLRNEFEEWKQTDEILRKQLHAGERISDLENILNPLTQKHFSSAQTGKVVHFKRYLFAAAAVAAIFLVILLLPNGIDNYSVSPMPHAVVRGDENAVSKGAQFFNDKKYKEAIALFEQSLQNNPDDATTQFYYAISLIKEKRYSPALDVLKPMADGKSAYKGDANFFAAYADWKLGNKEEALSYAEKVPESSSYISNARKLIKKLK